MRKIDSAIVEEASVYVTELLDHELSRDYLFHSKAHTLDVLGNVKTIGEYLDVTEDEMNILQICALFHDVGYVKVYTGHEEESAARATAFLKARMVDEAIISQVTSAILATKPPQQPKDNIAEILCDADLMHLTYDNYFEQIELMRIEWRIMNIAHLSDYNFNISSIDFFKSHQYHTQYGKEVLQGKKEYNLSMIVDKIRGARRKCHD